MHQDGAETALTKIADLNDRQILDALGMAVVLLDDRLRVRRINPAAEMLLAVSARRAEGRPVEALIGNGNALLEQIRKAGRSGESYTLREARLVVLASAEEVLVDCSVTPVQGGRRAGGLVVELSRVDHLARITRDAWLSERHAASQAVMRGLAHEIKNPLGGLRGAAQLLDRELDDRELREYTRIITHEADRLRNLVDRMIGPDKRPERRLLNLHEVLEHVRKLILVEIQEGLTVDRDYDPSLPDIEGDREALIQAVLNIVRNAVQAMQGRGVIRLRTRVERQLTIGARRYRHVLRADIEDNGSGVPDALREKIFYPMVTGRADGTGLGLSIAQDIINRHGGKIECDSRPGYTCMSLFLPVGETS
jgi:two-component system nitrogen regulation sensor histidine kinase GlnL